MALIAVENLKYYLSGGTSNSDPAASIGGAKSTTTTAAADIFADVSGDDALAGEVYYRCVYVSNEDANASGWLSPKMWISTAEPAAGDAAAIALGAAAKNGTETAVANQHTAPTGPTFSAPITKGTGIALPTLGHDEYQAIWLKHTVGASTAAASGVTFDLNCEGDSSA